MNFVADRLTSAQFAHRAEIVHGKRYNYNRVNYINMLTKVEIICWEHGPFFQVPDNHLWHQNGCPKCARNKRYDTESWVERAQEIHGTSHYDYSLVNYVSARHKVELICSAHGQFSQLAAQHLKGKGCVKCGQQRHGFVRAARLIHGDRFDYRRVVYIDKDTPVEIFSLEDGSIWQTPNEHLQSLASLEPMAA